MQTVQSLVRQRLDSSQVITPEALISEAISRMAQSHSDFLLVADSDDNALGLLALHEVLTRVRSNGSDPNETSVSTLMMTDCPKTSSDSSLEQAIDLMQAFGCRELVVVSDNTILGVVTFDDIACALIDDRDAQIRDLIIYITRG